MSVIGPRPQLVRDMVYKIVIKLGSTPIAAIDLLAARKGGAETLGLGDKCEN